MTRRQTEKTIGWLGAVTAAGAVGGVADGLRGAVAIIGPRSFLQPTMCGVGIAMVALGARLHRDIGAATRRSPAA